MPNDHPGSADELGFVQRQQVTLHHFARGFREVLTGLMMAPPGS